MNVSKADGEQVLTKYSAPILRATCALTGAGDRAGALAFVLSALRRDGFKRLESLPEGEGRETYLMLQAREILAAQIPDLLRSSPEKGWARFERVFRKDVERRIASRARGDSAADWADLYQNVVLRLVEGEYRRLKAYKGAGSYTGFVLRVVDNLIVDVQRAKSGRLRLPAVIKAMPEFEQAVFRLLAWRGVRDRRSDVMGALPIGIEADGADLDAAIARVRAAAAEERQRLALRPKFVPWTEAASSQSVEADQDEEQYGAFLRLLRDLRPSLTEQQQIYLDLVLDAALPPRAIADHMGVPVQEVYRLGEQIIRLGKARLRQIAEVGGA